MVNSNSRRHLSTVSSMRAGWIRPSVIKRSNAMRATSLRTWSKLERVMASGVSSIINSTPVAVSRVRIFRPSLPIIRPFISSLGKGTTVTVASLEWSAAQRANAWLISSLAIWSASSLVCASKAAIRIAFSWANCSSTRLNSKCFASSWDKAAMASNFSNWRTFICSNSSRRASTNSVRFFRSFSFCSIF